MKASFAWLPGLLLLGACAADPPRYVEYGPGGPVLRWLPHPLGPDETDLRYEVAIHEVERGLPRRRVVFATDLATPSYAPAGLPRGDYLWSVRTRFRRDGADWVTRWDAEQHEGLSILWAVEPQRGFAALTIH